MQQANTSDSLHYVTFQVKSSPLSVFFIHDSIMVHCRNMFAGCGHGVPSDQTVGIPFVVGKEVIRVTWERSTWTVGKPVKVVASPRLMSEPLLCGTKDLWAMSRQKLKMAVGLLPGHTTLRAHMFRLWLTQRQNSDSAGTKEKIVYILYESNSISKLQIQVATYVFELSAGNRHR
jgi:hypothetical protein